MGGISSQVLPLLTPTRLTSISHLFNLFSIVSIVESIDTGAAWKFKERNNLSNDF